MNWIKADELVFKEYGIEVTTERKLKDGLYIKHFELSNEVMVLCHLDPRVTLYTNEALIAYLEFVEGE